MKKNKVKLTKQKTLRYWANYAVTESERTVAHEVLMLREIVRAFWLEDNSQGDSRGLVFRHYHIPSEEQAAWIHAVLNDAGPDGVTVKLKKEDAEWLARPCSRHGRYACMFRIKEAVKRALDASDE